MLRNILFCSVIFSYLPTAGLAAQTGKIDYPYLGIQFTIPQGWEGGIDGNLFVMGSNTDPGLMAIIPNEAKNVQDLKTEADKGIYDDSVQLTRSGEFERVGVEGLGAEFSGYAEFQAAKAFVIGLINPYGQSVTVAAMTTEALYSDKHKKFALALANSVVFAQPVESEAVKEWSAALSGSQVRYMNTSGGSGSSYTDASGYSETSYSSISETRQYDLCSDNRFTYYSSSSASFDSASGFGAMGGQDDSSGTWKVMSQANGDGTLVLSYLNGEIEEYDLSRKGKRTYLDGTRYTVTSSKQCY